MYVSRACGPKTAATSDTCAIAMVDVAEEDESVPRDWELTSFDGISRVTFNGRRWYLPLSFSAPVSCNQHRIKQVGQSENFRRMRKA